MDQEPQIRITDFVEGARNARGAVVIIDVFRAFSTACYAFANGARRIIPVADIAHARKLRESDPGLILMGERGGKKLPGFDFGNSPTEIRDADFTAARCSCSRAIGTSASASSSHRPFTARACARTRRRYGRRRCVPLQAGARRSRSISARRWR